jgi:hypothetical protein
MILVPLHDLKFLEEIAAPGAGTSNRWHYANGARHLGHLRGLPGAKPAMPE